MAAKASKEEKAHFEVMCWLSGISMVHFIIPLLCKKVKTSAFLADGVGENKTASVFVYMTIASSFISKLFSWKTICWSAVRETVMYILKRFCL